MADKAFHLEIVTPDRALYTGEVTSVVAPGAAGSFGVLANHAPMIAALGMGELKLREPSGHERMMALKGGFFEVSANKAIVLADGGEWQEEIDLPRAEKAFLRAQERVMGNLPGIDKDRARAAYERAKVRMKIAKARAGVR
jgi:F-type H+-transporting ATPase subunit epsilon